MITQKRGGAVEYYFFFFFSSFRSRTVERSPRPKGEIGQRETKRRSVHL